MDTEPSASSGQENPGRRARAVGRPVGAASVRRPNGSDRGSRGADQGAHRRLAGRSRAAPVRAGGPGQPGDDPRRPRLVVAGARAGDPRGAGAAGGGELAAGRDRRAPGTGPRGRRRPCRACSQPGGGPRFLHGDRHPVHAGVGLRLAHGAPAGLRDRLGGDVARLAGTVAAAGVADRLRGRRSTPARPAAVGAGRPVADHPAPASSGRRSSSSGAGGRSTSCSGALWGGGCCSRAPSP